MEENVDEESQLRFEKNYAQSMSIDPKRARFPYCIVWTPLPVISWLIPFVGHIGICREDGAILDFAGPNFVCVDNFAFGSARRYIQINMEKDCCIGIAPQDSIFEGEDQYQHNGNGRDSLTWDGVLRKSTQEYQHRSYNLFTCNCHSFVANNLNRMGFQSGGWNVVNLATLILLKGQWVSKASMVQSYLPFGVVSVVGLTFWGWSYLSVLALINLILVGWFVLGTYCFRNVIQL